MFIFLQILSKNATLCKYIVSFFFISFCLLFYLRDFYVFFPRHILTFSALSRLHPIPTLFFYFAIFSNYTHAKKQFVLRVHPFFASSFTRADNARFNSNWSQARAISTARSSFCLQFCVVEVFFSFLAERSPACFNCCFCVYFLSITAYWQAKLRRN